MLKRIFTLFTFQPKRKNDDGETSSHFYIPKTNKPSSYHLLTKCGRYGPGIEDFDYTPDRIRRSVKDSCERLVKLKPTLSL